MGKAELYVNDTTLTENVSEHYRKFFDKFKEIDTLPIGEWKALHILSYLCRKYETHYGLKYSFKFNNPAPSKSFEIYQIKKLSNMLSTDAQILKDYIDWVFDKKVIARKKRITSLGYFTYTDIVNEFKFKFLFNKKPISRADLLPSGISEICNKHGLSNITTYMELAFIKKLPDKLDLMEELKSSGFDISILDKIA